MKRLDIAQSSYYAPIASSRFQEPFTESEILLLQDKFLNNGFQRIQVKNIQLGRTLIETFLESMHMHNSIACLTLEQAFPKSTVSDIYYELMANNYINDNLEQFFIDQCYYDFMWIEATPELKANKWFSKFEQYIIDYKLDQHIPIMILSYQEY